MRKIPEGGFSLLEVFIALLILSIGVFGLAMLELTAVTARIPLASAKVRTATGLAQATLDRFRDTPWRDLRSSHTGGFQRGPEGVSPAFSQLSASTGDLVIVQGTTYFRIWQVTQDPGIPSLKTISVWSCWQAGDGRWRQVVLVTQRADMGT
jgi:hypothetical protein